MADHSQIAIGKHLAWLPSIKQLVTFQISEEVMLTLKTKLIKLKNFLGGARLLPDDATVQDTDEHSNSVIETFCNTAIGCSALYKSGKRLCHGTFLPLGASGSCRARLTSACRSLERESAPQHMDHRGMDALTLALLISTLSSNALASECTCAKKTGK
jgi:hypothetical protein